MFMGAVAKWAYCELLTKNVILIVFTFICTTCNFKLGCWGGLLAFDDVF